MDITRARDSNFLRMPYEALDLVFDYCENPLLLGLTNIRLAEMAYLYFSRITPRELFPFIRQFILCTDPEIRSLISCAKPLNQLKFPSLPMLSLQVKTTLAAIPFFYIIETEIQRLLDVCDSSALPILTDTQDILLSDCWICASEAAITNNDLITSSLLLTHPDTHGIPAEELWRVLYQSIRYQRTAVVALVLKHPNLVSLPSSDYSLGHALYKAVLNKSPAIVSLILDHQSAVPLSGDYSLGYALYIAISSGCTAISSLILFHESFADISAQGLYGLGHALFMASWKGYSSIALFILEHPNAAFIPDEGLYGFARSLEIATIFGYTSITTAILELVERLEAEEATDSLASV